MTQSLTSINRGLTLPVLAAIGLAVGMLASGIALRTISPNKFVYLADVRVAAADQSINIVFSGTSKIRFGIIPDVFDEAMRYGGVEDVRSWNFGYDGGSTLVSYAEIEALFDLRRNNMKFVFVEPDFRGLSPIREPNTMRAIEFFSIRNALRAAQYMDYPIRQPAPAITTAQYTTNIVTATIRHYSNIGLAWAKPDPGDVDILSGSRGYPVNNKLAYRAFSAEEEYFVTLHNIDTLTGEQNLISDRQLAMVLSLASLVESNGATPILLVPPGVGNSEFMAASSEKFRQRCSGRGPLFFDYGSPVKYPDLYAPENRMDEDHLNARGAALFSALVADRLSEAIRAGSPSLPLCSLN